VVHQPRPVAQLFAEEAEFVMGIARNQHRMQPATTDQIGHGDLLAVHLHDVRSGPVRPVTGGARARLELRLADFTFPRARLELADGGWFPAAGDWAVEERITNLSYFVPYAHPWFGSVDPGGAWDRVTEVGYDLLGRALEDPSRRLPPAFIRLDPGGALRELSPESGLETEFSFDAIRTFWRVEADCRMHGRPEACGDPLGVPEALGFLIGPEGIASRYAPDGTRLFVREFLPARAIARSLMLLHGATVHGGRLEPLARFFQARGYHVVVPDLRGHGRSDGCPMHVRIFDEYVEDIETIRAERIGELEPSAVLGVSMGGLIAVRHVQRYSGRFRSLGLVSPLLGLGFPLPNWLLFAGRVLSWIRPRTRFQSILKPEEVSKRPMPLTGEGADPLVHRSVTAGWYFAMRAALEEAWAEREQIQCPVSIVQAERDCVVDPEATRQWSSIFANLSSRRRVFRVLRGHCHDFLGEPNWTRAAKLFALRMARDLDHDPQADHNPPFDHEPEREEVPSLPWRAANNHRPRLARAA